MISLGIAFAGMLAVMGVLTRAKAKPSMCPKCRAMTLVPDPRGTVWICGPCGRRFLRVGADLLPHDDQPAVIGEERIPTATLRRPDD